MGMDVFGRKPTAEQGKYFRRNIWGWRRLAKCVTELAPQETRSCTHWHTNDGDGLNKAQSIRLADKLDELLASGAIESYVQITDAEIATKGRVQCVICNGTGIRTDAVGEANHMPDTIVNVGPDDDPGNPRVGLKGWCNGCNGWGSTTHPDSWYGLETNDVREFSAFIRASGGFRIE